MTEFGLLDVAARGMTAQRELLDVDARNVAAAQAATPGHPYARLVARFVAAPAADMADVPDPDPDPNPDGDDDGMGPDPVTITREAGTGDALTELIATLDAQRAYEADASIFDIGKRLAERTLDIER
jgi:flagellar basal body rod protein FlgC